VPCSKLQFSAANKAAPWYPRNQTGPLPLRRLTGPSLKRAGGQESCSILNKKCRLRTGGWSRPRISSLFWYILRRRNGGWHALIRQRVRCVIGIRNAGPSTQFGEKDAKLRSGW